MKFTLNSTEINLETLESYAADNQDFILEILNIYLEEMPIEYEILSKEIDQKNNIGIVFQAHKMKNNCQLCGVQPITDLLFSLEDGIDKNNNLDLLFIKNEINKCILESITLIEKIKSSMLINKMN
jgi:HPt (histidine-containing phosphotransfer) domain-containing protein